jgi:hypothetical protein
MNFPLVQSVPQGELQQLLELATNYRTDRQPYMEVLPKLSRKLNYRTGVPPLSLDRNYSFDEYPALAIGVYLDVSF